MKKRPYLWLAIVFIFFINTAPNTTYALEAKTEEDIKAKFITNYIPYIKWPSSVHSSGEPITVCVMDGDLTAAYLQKYNDADSKINLKVKEKDKKSDFSECNILYINKAYSADKGYFIKATKGKPIFTVSDIPGFSEDGGITGFQIAPGKDVTLEINMRSVEASHIEVDPDLLAIMKVFK